MAYKLQDLIDIEQFQYLQDRLNAIYAFPSAIIDNEGNILTATAWQEVCTHFHRKNPVCAQDCLKSDQYIISHLHEANPAISYRCPRGLVDNATPIIIDGIHYGNFFTGQFFLDAPDLEFFRQQAKEFEFDEAAYLEAVKKVPVWSRDQLDHYLFFIKGLIEVIASSGLKKMHEMETRKEIEATEARANLILQTMLDSFWIIDAQSARILDVNPAMCRMLGYTQAELLTMSVADVEANDSPEDVAERIRLVIHAGEASFESRFRRKDGQVIDVDISITYLPESKLIFGFHREITERKQTEEALQKSESMLKRVQEVAHLGSWEIDLTTKTVTASAEAHRIYGIQPGSMTLDFIQAVPLPEYRPILDAALAALITKGQPYDVEFKIRRVPDSETRDIHSLAEYNAARHTLIGSLQDITERKRAEAALQKSEAQFRAIIELSPVPYALNNDQQQIVYLNSAFIRTIGYDLNDIPTLADWWSRAYPDSEYRQWVAESWQAHVNQVKAGAAEFEPLEVQIYCKDGCTKTFIVGAGALGESFKDTHLVIFYDITERKQAEEQIKTALAEKEILLRELYHRTKNNMNVIIAMLTLQAGYTHDPTVEAIFHDTQNRIQAMALVHQMLYQAKDLSRINLRQYFIELLKLLLQGYSLPKDHITLELELSEVETMIDTAIPCGLILNELVSNALKYAFPNGQAGMLKIHLARLDHQTLELVFADNGVGVPAGFDFRAQETLGFQTIISLTEHQLQGQASFENQDGIIWHLQFRDGLYTARI